MATNNYKIVIAEDEPFLAGMYASKLENSGFTVLRAPDGELALKVIKEQNPDIVLLDVMMPKIDWFDVLKSIRQDQNTARIPVLLLTNLDNRSDIEKGMRLGANDYIVKSNYTQTQ